VTLESTSSLLLKQIAQAGPLLLWNEAVNDIDGLGQA
jgi:hypothetical protein